MLILTIYLIGIKSRPFSASCVFSFCISLKPVSELFLPSFSLVILNNYGLKTWLVSHWIIGAYRHSLSPFETFIESHKLNTLFKNDLFSITLNQLLGIIVFIV